jgi:nicotinamidase/pyrazinamidase
MADAVIVVDMLRGFLEKGYPLYCGDDAQSVIPPIQKLLAEEKARGSAIFFIGDCHGPDDPEFKVFPPHCLMGTAEAEVIPELQDYATNSVIAKTRYSGFFETTLEQQLFACQPGKIIVCGVCTDICVMHTVADARNRNYTVEVPVDCVASFDSEANRWALRHMRDILGAKLTHIREQKL